MRFAYRSRSIFLVALFASLALITSSRAVAEDRHNHHRLIAVPTEDRFLPFSLVIKSGDTVDWTNNDSDDHTVVSDDFFNTTGPKNVDVIIPANGGTFSVTFKHKGVWVFYCRFHSHLDADNQPVAPGPEGGIQGEKDPTKCDPAGTDTCNFGTPMMGVITVIPGDDDHDD